MFSLQLLRPITHTKFHKALYFPWKILQLNGASTYSILDGRGRMGTSKEKCCALNAHISEISRVGLCVAFLLTIECQCPPYIPEGRVGPEYFFREFQTPMK